MKINLAIDIVSASEQNLADVLERLSRRHVAEHDVYHLGHAQASKAITRARTLAEVAQRYGADEPDGAAPEPGLMDAARRRASELLRHNETPGVVLLVDLQEAYVQAQEAEIAWVVLLQGAKACRDSELVKVATGGHEGCEAAAKWLRTRIKVAAPQVLAAG